MALLQRDWDDRHLAEPGGRYPALDESDLGYPGSAAEQANEMSALEFRQELEGVPYPHQPLHSIPPAVELAAEQRVNAQLLALAQQYPGVPMSQLLGYAIATA
jgi:hypothetical protein